MMNLYSGKVKINNIKYPILWDGEHAEHIAKNYIEDNKIHPFLHIRIQQLLINAITIQTTTGIYSFNYDSEYGYVVVILIKSTNFVRIKTCFTIKSMESFMKGKVKIKISGATIAKRNDLLLEMKEYLIKENELSMKDIEDSGFSTLEQYCEFMACCQYLLIVDKKLKRLKFPNSEMSIKTV